MTHNGKALLSGFEFENIKLEQMNNKELLIDFIEYAKSRHVMPILHSNIEPLVDDYLRQQNLQQCSVSRRFDGCSTCKNNIPGVEAGLWCINNCIAGSRYEAAQNGS